MTYSADVSPEGGGDKQRSSRSSGSAVVAAVAVAAGSLGFVAR